MIAQTQPVREFDQPLTPISEKDAMERLALRVLCGLFAEQSIRSLARANGVSPQALNAAVLRMSGRLALRWNTWALRERLERDRERRKIAARQRRAKAS